MYQSSFSGVSRSISRLVLVIVGGCKINSESSDAFDIAFRRDWLSEQITAASLPGTSTWPGIHCSTALPEDPLSFLLISSESSDAFNIAIAAVWVSWRHSLISVAVHCSCCIIPHNACLPQRKTTITKIVEKRQFSECLK